jgi:hypothetical protein
VGWTFRSYSNVVSPDRSTLRTVFRDTFRSSAISLIVLPLIKCPRRIRPIVFTISIPPLAARFESQRAAHQSNLQGVNFGRRSPGSGVRSLELGTQLVVDPSSHLMLDLMPKFGGREQFETASFVCFLVVFAVFTGFLGHFRPSVVGDSKPKIKNFQTISAVGKDDLGVRATVRALFLQTAHSAQRLDCLADDAVHCEPVSAPHFPANRECIREILQIQALRNVFDAQWTGEFKGFNGNSLQIEQGISRHVSGKTSRGT